MDNKETKKVSIKDFWTKLSYSNARLIVIGIAIVLICAVIVILNFKYLTELSHYQYSSVSDMFYGQGDHRLIIDNGKKTLLLVDGNSTLLKRYDGGSEKGVFCYVYHAVEAEDGSIYIADIVSGNRGNLLDKERIIHIKNGKRHIVHEIDYTDWPEEETPLQYGRILDLKEYEGNIYFIYADNTKAGVYKLGSEGTEPVKEVDISERLNDAAYDFGTGTFVLSYRTGELSVIYPDGSVQDATALERQIPFDLTVSSGMVYYTELIGNTICGFNIDSPGEISVLTENDGALYKLDYSERLGEIMTTDYYGYMTVPTADNGAESEYFEEIKVSYLWREILARIALGIGAIAAVALIIRALYKFVLYLMKNEQGLRITFIILACIAVAAIISYTLLKRVLSDNVAASEEKVTYFADILLQYIDGDSIDEIKSPSDYDGASFNEIKAPLDEKIKESYENGDYYYYIVYKTEGNSLTNVMDFEEAYTCFTPLYPADEEPYHGVMQDGEKVIYSENSAYGAWTFVLLPIYDSKGNIIAELEVGQSLDAINRDQAALVKEIIINSGISTIVIAMLLLEVTFLLSFAERRRKVPLFDQDPTDKVAVRTMMFLSYLMDSMQDAFIVLLCTQLYKGGLPISDGIAVALPMSGQLFMMAIASFFVGRLTERVGTKNTMISGVILQMAGCIICLAMGNYTGILIGKLLIGAGMGTIYVSCNTVAAMGSTAEKAGEAFAGVSAGTLSGLTIGAGLSSVLLSIGGWKLIYASGIGIMGVALLIAGFSGDAKPAKTGDITTTKDINLIRFLFNPRILPFFLMILVPFMISLSFREYFFPLVASESGLGEAQIGQIYLLCGMGVLYLGPLISGWILKKLGAYWSILIASTGMVAAMVLYVVHPSFVSVIIGVIVLSLVISFAYTCQYTYFELLPECTLYGSGNAMGVYSVFESAGQTLGPIAYGLFLGFGYRQGIFIAMVILIGLTLIFFVLSRSTAKFFK